MLEADCIVTHVLSQILYKWIPLPQYQEAKYRLLKPASEWDEAAWLAYINQSLSSKAVTTGWVKIIQSSPTYKPSFLKYLVEQIINHLRFCRHFRAHYIPYCHPKFPKELKHIPDPPAAITVLGKLDLLLKPKIAIVGSRHAKLTSLLVAQKLASEICTSGICVVSGGAIGCDKYAHLGSLSTSETCSTISVMAGGLGHLYPRSNFKLFEKIKSQGGAIVSEKLWQSKPKSYDFPVRNRIIAGLAKQTIIIQAKKNSGTMTTAHLALKYGRDVIVYQPQQINTDNLGNFQLIDDGAQSFYDSASYWEID